MMTKILSVLGLTISGLLICVGYLGCGQNTNQYTLGGITATFQGPGSVYSYYVNAANALFVIYHQAMMINPFDYVGVSTTTYTTATGFTQATITNVGPQDNGMAPVGTINDFVSIPGYILFMQPYAAGPTLAGVPPLCSGVDMSMSFIKLRQASGWVAGVGGANGTGDTFGSLTYVAGNGSFTINHDYNVTAGGATAGTDLGSKVIETAVGCVNGEVNDSTNESFVSTSSGLVHNTATNDIYFAIVPNATVVAASDLIGPMKFAGMLYQAHGPTNKNVTLTMTGGVGSDSIGTLQILSDVTDSTSNSAGAAISLSHTALAGAGQSTFIPGTYAGFPMICMATLAQGTSTPTQSMIACSGSDGTDFMSLLLVSY